MAELGTRTSTELTHVTTVQRLPPSSAAHSANPPGTRPGDLRQGPRGGLDKLSAEGLNALDTNRVAEEASVNIAALYFYFVNREGMLALPAQRFEGARATSIEERRSVMEKIRLEALHRRPLA